MMAAAVGCGLLPLGCVKEDAASLGEQHDVAVQLNVGTRAVSETNGTPTNDESAIHTLRVYAFVDGKPAGHYFTDNVLVDEATKEHTFFMDITFYTTGTQTVDFYVVANEAAMEGVNISGSADNRLSENTTDTQLKNLWFIDYQENIQQYGLPMFCDKQSIELDFRNVKQGSPTDLDHTDHSWLDYDNISFELKRPFGKLGVFAAKTEGETATLRVTGLTMLESGTRMRNYLMTPTTEQLEGITNASGDIRLPVVEGEVEAKLADNISDAERQKPENYTPVLAAPFYPFENPWGNGGSWNIPGSDRKEHVLKIDYTFGDEARTGYIYLPAIERNHYYAICCLMHNDGKITIEYTVADWDDGGEYKIEFNYPQYTNPIQPENGTTLEGAAKYPQPTVYVNPAGISDEGSYTFRFEITGPTGQQWTPTLVGAEATLANFEVQVYQILPDGSKNYIENAAGRVASSDPYYITVKAKDANNVGGEVGLGIAYDRSWSTDGSALLLINGLTGNLKWDGSSVAEVIMIRQVEVPESTIND